MAKEIELVSKSYKEIQVVPAAAKDSGEMELNESTLGFYLTEFTAAMLALGESATLIVEAENTKVTKKAGEIWVAGQPIYWLEATSNFSNVPDVGSKIVGKASEAATSPAVIGYVLMKDYYPNARGFIIGTGAIPVKIIADDPLLKIYATTAVIAGTTRVGNINLVPTVATAGVLEALRVNITSAVRTGEWTNAIVGRIDYGALGDAAGGMAAAICAEMNLPGKVNAGGAMYCLDLEMNAQENGTVVSGHTVAFQKFGLWGDATAITSFITNGYFMDIQGVASVTDGFFEEVAVTAGVVFDACLKIKIGNADYFIGLCDDKTFA